MAPGAGARVSLPLGPLSLVPSAGMVRVPLSLRVEGARVALRAPRMSDAPRLIDVRQRSWRFLSPWMPVPDPGAEEVQANRRQIHRQRREWQEDKAYPLFIVDRLTDQVVGRVAFNNVVRGVFQNAYLGYWIDVQHARKGLMTEALRLAMGAAFGPMGLHRLQAAIIPRNTASLAVIRKAGFRQEGLAERYLRIAGEWEDHVIFALTAEEWRAR